MSTRSTDGVHQTHCCSVHGCKYAEDKSCPVVSGRVVQEYLCEFCDVVLTEAESRVAEIRKVRELAAKVDGVREVEPDGVRALREAADAWQLGGWASAPRLRDRVEERLAHAQYVTDWLRERVRTEQVRAVEKGEKGEKRG